MAEENVNVEIQTEDQPSVQQEAVTEFFTEKLVDDDGNPIEVEAEEKKTQEEKPDGKDKSKSKEAESKETEKPKPIGFEEKFFEKDEKGNLSFNANTALDVLIPKDDAGFRYSIPKFEPPKVSDSTQTPDNRAAWEKELETEKQYRTDVKTRLLSPLEAYKKARNELGYDENQAFTYAQQAALGDYENHISERDWDMRAKKEKEYEERTSSVTKQTTIKQTARSNELAMAQSVGSEENYRALMFGYKNEKGDIVPGIGSNLLYKLFEISNSGVRKLDQKNYTDKLNSWWTEFTGDSEEGLNNLQYVMDLVKLQLLKKYHPLIVDKIRGVKEKELQKRKEGQIKGKSGMEAQGRESKQNNTVWDRYLKGPSTEDTV